MNTATNNKDFQQKTQFCLPLMVTKMIFVIFFSIYLS